MFYEERIIEGQLCYRTSPKHGFQPCTLEQLTKKLTKSREEIEKLKSDVEFHAWEVPGFWQGELDKANGRAAKYRTKWAEVSRILMGLQAELVASSNPAVRGGAPCVPYSGRACVRPAWARTNGVKVPCM